MATSLRRTRHGRPRRRWRSATGSSPLSVYRELIRRHREENLSFKDAQAFLLDEYVGLPPSHPQSYAHVIRTVLTDHIDIDPERVHGPNGVAADIFADVESHAVYRPAT